MSTDEYPLPPPLRGSEPDTWAQLTINVRLGERILKENDDLPPDLKERLQSFLEEVPNQRIVPLQELHSSPATVLDIEEWNVHILQHYDGGLTWHSAPWWFCENYFYRRGMTQDDHHTFPVLEAIGFFDPASEAGFGYDPFKRQKTAGLHSSFPQISDLCDTLGLVSDDIDQTTVLRKSLLISLWGNQADLSIWPVEHDKSQKSADTSCADVSCDDNSEKKGERLLVDDTARVVEQLLSITDEGKHVDVFIDNAAFELVCDLCLVDAILSHTDVACVVVHLKAYPTFVSDATQTDVEETVAWLSAATHRSVAQLGQRLEEYIGQGSMVLRPDRFFNSPLLGWEMPAHGDGSLAKSLKTSGLVIVKGDAHYRRLLGDRHWDFATPFSKIMKYFPAPVVALRTLKSELACGLSPSVVARAQARSTSHLCSCWADTEWLTNGSWGVVQFADAST